MIKILHLNEQADQIRLKNKMNENNQNLTKIFQRNNFNNYKMFNKATYFNH